MAPIKSNNPFASYFDFFGKSGLDAVTPAPLPAPPGITATGGVISDYEDSGTLYRAHVFTSSGALNVTIGSVVYALPLEIISISSTDSPTILAAAVALTPHAGSGSVIVIVGGEVYPVPALPTTILSTV